MREVGPDWNQNVAVGQKGVHPKIFVARPPRSVKNEEMLTISRSFQIPDSEIELSYVRSSGPGGQNVNKVSSKCQLRWNAVRSPSVPAFHRERLLERLRPRLTREGDVLLSSDTYRDQGRNREECLEKLRALLIAALHVPKARKETEPTRSSQRKRVNSKRKQSEKKGRRGRVSDD
jgi:ribosome-associated protein